MVASQLVTGPSNGSLLDALNISARGFLISTSTSAGAQLHKVHWSHPFSEAPEMSSSQS